MNGSEFAFLDSVITAYLPNLEALACEESKHRIAAAALTSQCYQLKSLLALHRNDLEKQAYYSKQGVVYATTVNDPALLVAALIKRADTFYYGEAPVEFLETYVHAQQYLHNVSLSLQVKIAPMLAVGYARTGDKTQAERCLRLAQQTFSRQATNTEPGSSSYTYNPAQQFTLWEGVTRLELNQPEATWKAFTLVEKLQQAGATPERVQVEIMNQMAEAAIGMREMGLFCEYLERGRQGAVRLGSQRRWQEAYTIYHQGKGVWPREAAVRNLAKQFVR